MAPAGREIIRASIDGFHRPRADRYRQGADSARGYYEDSFDHDALRRALLEPLGPGGDRRYRTALFDFRTDSTVEAPVGEAAADAVLVLDGVFLQRPELCDGWEVAIFVAVEPEECLRRALERDLALFGSPEEIERRYRTRYLPGQLLYLEDARPLDHAHFIVTNDDPARPELSGQSSAAGELSGR